MSKYSVAVILKKETSLEDVKKEVDKILYNFSTQTKVEPYIKYTKKDMETKFNNYKDKKDALKESSFFSSEKSLPDFKDLREFSEFYTDYDIDENGNVLSNSNPNSKFDSYMIGGRYENNIKTSDSKHVTYSKIENIIFNIELQSQNIINLKKMYDVLVTEGDFYTPEYYKERYPKFEDFLEDRNFSTYAIADYRNNWFEAGPMKSFGISSATPQELLKFQKKYRDIIDSYDKEDILVLVECSISSNKK